MTSSVHPRSRRLGRAPGQRWMVLQGLALAPLISSLWHPSWVPPSFLKDKSPGVVIWEKKCLKKSLLKATAASISSTTTQLLYAIINELCISCTAWALKLPRAAHAHPKNNPVEAGGGSGSCAPARGSTSPGLRAALLTWEPLLSLSHATFFSVPHYIILLQIDVLFPAYFFPIRSFII